MKKRLIPFTFLSLLTFWCGYGQTVQAQNHQIEGTVTDAQSQQVLPGVNIAVQGTSRGTSTDENGTYSLRVPSAQDTLVLSFIGYKTKSVPINGRSTINVELEPSALNLDEIVVVGYDTQSKRDLTGAIGMADVEELQSFPTPNVKSMLEGRLAGVEVLPNNEPGGEGTIRIRGYNTVRDSDPLYVIDGIPTTTGMNKVNPFNIASVQVLKDAASASIYGSRAANGVVLVTTKKGQQKDLQVSVNAYSGIQQVYNLPTMLGAQEYGDLLWEASRNDGIEPASDIYGSGSEPAIPQWLDDARTIPSDNVDWVDKIFEPAPVQSYNLGLSQGDENSSQLFSVGYFKQEGTLRYTGYERLSARLNSEYILFDRFTIGENVGAAYQRQTSIGSNSALGSPIYSAYQFPSITPVYDINGDFAGNPLNDQENPLGNLYRNKDNTGKRLNILGNVYASWEFLDQVTIKSNLGIDYYSYNMRNFSPAFEELLTQQAESSLSTTSNYGYNWVWSNTLNIIRQFGNHHFEALVGTEAILNYVHNFSASRLGFPSTDPNFRYLSAGSGSDQKNSGDAMEWSLFSQFGKINYNYDERYLVAFTLRHDGTSRLGDNRYSLFPAVSAGWRISNEPFFSSGFIDDLKLRFSWGQNGNQNIPPYSSITSYSSNPNYSNYPIGGQQNAVNAGYTQTRNGNGSLEWEQTTQTDIGIDATMFGGKLYVTADYFIKKTEGLLLERPLIPAAGGTNQTIWDNAGQLENRGLEFLIEYNNPSDAEFNYSVGLNGSVIRNELTSLPGDVNYLGLSSSALHTVNFDQEISRSDEGHPLSSFYGYVYDGLFQSKQEVQAHGAQAGAVPGDIRFKDINEDGVIDSDDRTFIGSPLPDFSLGLNLGANWKAWDFSAFINGTFGNDIYDLTRYKTDFFNQSAYNKHERTLNAWTPENTDTRIPRLSLNDNNNNIRPSSYYVFDGSYVRLQNVQVGYTVPGFGQLTGEGSRLRFYIQAQNLLTITGYDGLDPAVGLRNNIDIGVDRGLYPPSRTFSLGLNLTL